MFIVLFSARLYADSSIKVFLQPQASYNGDNLTVGDIASLEGDTDLVSTASSLIIPVELCRDRYLEESELIRLLKTNGITAPVVYGSAVRLVVAGNNSYNKNSAKTEYLIIGSPVKVIMRNKGIVIELEGQVLEQARVGERVSVRISDKRVMQGKIVSREIVEIVL